jgi:hypothetical protein
MTKFENVLLEDYMNKYSIWTLEDFYYYQWYCDNLFGDHTLEYKKIIHSISILAELTRKES